MVAPAACARRDEAVDARDLCLADERPQVRVGRERVAHAHAVEELAEAGEEPLVHRALHVGSSGRGAVLAAVDERPRRGTAGRRLDVRVVEDDERRLAAEFEMDALEVRRGELLDRPARLRVAGQRDEIDVLVSCHRGAHDVPAARDDVEDAVRQPGLLRQFGQQIVVSGVAAAGFRTTEFPAESAGPTFQIAIHIG